MADSNDPTNMMAKNPIADLMASSVFMLSISSHWPTMRMSRELNALPRVQLVGSVRLFGSVFNIV
jgi:hypothetical protein